MDMVMVGLHVRGWRQEEPKSCRIKEGRSQTGSDPSRTGIGALPPLLTLDDMVSNSVIGCRFVSAAPTVSRPESCSARVGAEGSNWRTRGNATEERTQEQRDVLWSWSLRSPALLSKDAILNNY